MTQGVFKSKGSDYNAAVREEARRNKLFQNKYGTVGFPPLTTCEPPSTTISLVANNMYLSRLKGLKEDAPARYIRCAFSAFAGTSILGIYELLPLSDSVTGYNLKLVAGGAGPTHIFPDPPVLSTKKRYLAGVAASAIATLYGRDTSGVGFLNCLVVKTPNLELPRARSEEATVDQLLPFILVGMDYPEAYTTRDIY